MLRLLTKTNYSYLSSIIPISHHSTIKLLRYTSNAAELTNGFKNDNSPELKQEKSNLIKEGLSNRKLFMQQPIQAKTLELLDNLGAGQIKNPKFLPFNRKKSEIFEKIDLPPLQFFAGAKSLASIPKPTLPEIAVAGRSNVGKSRLLDTLLGSVIGGSAIRHADRPGVTKQLNFFTCGNKFHVVDMPGYGFAYAKEEIKVEWAEIIEQYLVNRRTLRLVYVLIDARHGFKSTDRDFMTMLTKHDIKFQIVLTKCDLVVRSVLGRRYDIMTQELADSYPTAFPDLLPISSLVQSGIPTLRKHLLHNTGYFSKMMKQRTIVPEIKLKQNQTTKDRERKIRTISKESPKTEVKKDKKIKAKGISLDQLKLNIYN